MKRPTLEDIIMLHDEIVAQSGGSEGIRDINLIDSAINSPFQSFGGFELYPTFEEKAAHLAYNLTMNHAFFDGNKRIGAASLIFFLKINGKKLIATDQQIIDLFLNLASEKIDCNDLLDWIKGHVS